MRPFLILLSWLIAMSGDAQFSPPIPISATASAPEPLPADLNGDGLMDVLGNEYSTGRVVWYAGSGSGIFGAQRVIANDLGTATSCFAIDLDQDGDLDIIASSGEYDKVVWYRNDGGGFFGQERLIANTADEPINAQAADLDGDGLPEVTIACRAGDQVSYIPNLGNGQFGTEVVISQLVDNAYMFFAADLDGDTQPDLVSISSTDDRVAWYQNLGNGNFGPQQNISTNAMTVTRAHPADMDGDGDMDILAALTNGSNTVVWYSNNGGGSWSQNTVATTSTILRSVFPSDLDGDGDMDVLSTASTDDEIYWYANNGSGVFGPGQVISNTVDNPGHVRTADMDQDGDVDVIGVSIADDRLEYYANNGLGQFGGAFVIGQSETSDVGEAAFADMNSDGLLDVFASSNDQISWYPNLGAGNWGAQQRFPLTDARDARTIDVEGDGDLDLIVVAGGGEFYQALNNGTGQFQPFTLLGDLYLLFDLTTGDLNNDGYDDILFAIEDQNGLKIALNNGAGQFSIPTTITATTQQLQAPLLTDMDQDGDLDLVYADASDDLIYWRANNANAQFGPTQVLGSTTSVVYHLSADDLNGDGLMDIVVGTEPDDLIFWFENLGGGQYGAQVIISSLNGPRGIDVADVDGDGDHDLVAASWFDDVIGWYSNDGTGNFGPHQVFSTSQNAPIHLVVNDPDGDGDPDVLVASNLDDRVVLYKNYFGSPYHMEGRLYHDLDGSGTPDPGEPAAPWSSVVTVPASSTALTDTGGSFLIYADTGSYDVQTLISNSFWQVTTVPPMHSVQLTSASPVASGLDLGIAPAVDTSLIIPSYTAMPGVCLADVEHHLSIVNLGTRIEQGVIALDLDTLFTFNSSVPAPDVTMGHHFEWNFSNLGYGEVRVIVLDLTRPDASHAGDTLNADFSVLREDTLGIVTHTFPSIWSEVLLCSYDPNDKLNAPAGTGPLGVVDIDRPYFDYTIRFQNTGNAPAVDVVLRDQLPDELQHDQVQVLGYSHVPDQVTIDAGGELSVGFNSINLPDSATDLLGSQGFFTFRAFVALGAAHGITVVNSASIYFDLNAPVITNSVVNTLVDCDLHSATITDLGSGLLQASPGITYQWYLDGAAIMGATEQQYLLAGIGTYNVVVTDQFGCSAQSAPFLVVSVNEESATMAPMIVAPNPTTGRIILRCSEPMEPEHRIEVLDMTGKVVGTYPGNGHRVIEMDVSDLTAGLILIRVIDSEGRTWSQRMVME